LVFFLLFFFHSGGKGYGKINWGGVLGGGGGLASSGSGHFIIVANLQIQ